MLKLMLLLQGECARTDRREMPDLVMARSKRLNAMAEREIDGRGKE